MRAALFGTGDLANEIKSINNTYGVQHLHDEEKKKQINSVTENFMTEIQSKEPSLLTSIEKSIKDKDAFELDSTLVKLKEDFYSYLDSQGGTQENSKIGNACTPLACVLVAGLAVAVWAVLVAQSSVGATTLAGYLVAVKVKVGVLGEESALLKETILQEIIEYHH